MKNMDIPLNGFEQSGIRLIKRAIELDSDRRYTESLLCYQEGIQLLLDCSKCYKDDDRKQNLRQRISQYIERAEKIKLLIEGEKRMGRYHEQIQIKQGSTGFSYEKIFGRFLRDGCQYVEVDDPYIRSAHQIDNFLRFCEVLVKSSCEVKVIKLTTGQDSNLQQQQQHKLELISRSLLSHGVQLDVQYTASLHDREIRLSNGWIVKIGRGLDFFLPPEGRLSIGQFDFELRPCHQTTVDIFYKPTM